MFSAFLLFVGFVGGTVASLFAANRWPGLFYRAVDDLARLVNKLRK